MPEERNSSLKYTRIPYEEIRKIIQSIKKRFDEFLLLKGFPPDTERYASSYALIDIIIRVDKRKAYYYCFHGMEINECKEAALYAYWIIKLRPFSITDKKYQNNSDTNTINETFAIFLIGLVLKHTGRIKITEETKTSYSDFLEYSFHFRSFTIDSFVVLIESISTETLEKAYPNLFDKPRGL